ncbi:MULTISPECIES: protein-L-isoaspartate(D-aspartate) O-methyltransferase [Salinivibrio]|uniref:Protein-L-isoaspartate O-methyltransferase n=2 Tax=Salinivibrio TaxID=51366 RepID=A0ABY7LI04_9GAMM|nr:MULTISPECIES: protein-L-isoaspartate(D-aspartate) O-methyltransferase [Salinivibrio]ODP96534.1 protein-L-isoaspartate O-methyltransferase [Salinivibrio sp. DV]OOF11460.1 protein-L-isoaspartate O-methyltransferase [Salinivibrio sp. PR5]OOF24241.1 protein-L-isoaspartate O-methyltransferase [Salinivibrio sp. IB574]OOF26209.1 protein-L-isoaspartate O-methyltransferase [Salinivibrio proteolyticus]OOF28759.1 protein-L-isoaspartate O-methyltransferase [Salinivibrio sp. IB872]
MSQAQSLIQFLQQQGIDNQSVLDAMQAVPRHLFVSEAMTHQAYGNNALPIGWGQTISQPYIVAKMTTLLNLRRDSRILEIGTGSGYQTAILAQLVDQVYSVERIKQLQMLAKRRLKQLDIYNVATKHGDGWQGWPAKGPYDGIIVTAAAERIPDALCQQLTEGGVMLIPVGEHQQTLIKVTRQGEEFLTETIESVRFVPLVAGELA